MHGCFFVTYNDTCKHIIFIVYSWSPWQQYKISLSCTSKTTVPVTMAKNHSFFIQRHWRTSQKNFFSAAPSLGCAHFRPIKALGTSQLVPTRSPGTSCCQSNIGPLSSWQIHTVHCHTLKTKIMYSQTAHIALIAKIEEIEHTEQIEHIKTIFFLN